MSYKEVRGSIFNSKAQALVNTVNCVGVMGKGIALEFRRHYPKMFKEYQCVCEKGELQPGQILPYRGGETWILNFAIKNDWKQPSKVEWIENCLKEFVSSYRDTGIKCRAMMDRDVTDLSGQEVQKRRDKSLKLGQEVSSFVEIDKKIHECVSFLWNPLNDTSSAFQRNALLLAADKHNDTYGIACILEMRLSAFFESDRVYWSISEQNLASSDFSSYSKRIYKNFDWPTIFSVPNAGRESNKFRSAEFIAFYGNPSLESSDLIPTRFIKMILVPAQYETKVKEVVPSVQGRIYPLTNSKVFYPKEELLKAEKHLIETIDYLQKLALPMPLSTEKFCDLVNTFSNFKERLGCSLTDELFSSKTIAHSFHGISHITRIRKKSKGCDVNYFRLDIFKNHPKLKEYLTWSAYWLASITHYTKWSENTFVDLKKEIVRSLKALLRNDILDQDKRQMVNKMLRRLSVD